MLKKKMKEGSQIKRKSEWKEEVGQEVMTLKGEARREGSEEKRKYLSKQEVS